MSRSFAQSVIGTLALLTVAACSAESNTSDGYQSAASGPYQASAMADEGDVEGAETRFYDAVHQPLHDLAAEVSDVDRVTAARLLEAREEVETGFDGDQVGLGDPFRSLVSAVDQSLTAIGHDPMPCAFDDEE